MSGGDALSLRGRTALITGSGRGIGRAIAIELAERGATVVSSDIERAPAQETADILRDRGASGHAVTLDVRDPASITAALDAIAAMVGVVDTLVNNAAVDIPKDLLSTTVEEWDAVQAVTLRGVFLMTRAILPQMLRAGRGVVINIASVNALEALGSDAYSAAKAGVLSLTKATAVQYGPGGVRAIAVCPGTIRTPAWDARLAADPGLLERVSNWYPAKRVGAPQDVASVVSFLVSDAASFMSGAIVTIDGGLTSGIEPLLRDVPSAGATSGVTTGTSRPMGESTEPGG